MRRATRSIRLAIAGAFLSLGAAQPCAAAPMKQGPIPTPEGEILLLDQLRVKGALPKAVIDELAPAHTMEAVIAIFDRRKVQFERNAIAVATTAVPATVLIAINKLPPGEPFIMPIGEGKTVTVTTINVLIDRLPADPVYTH